MMALAVMAQGSVSPAMRSVMRQSSSQQVLDAFVVMNDDNIASLERLGVRVNSHVGPYVDVTAPARVLSVLNGMSGVKSVSASHRVHLHCDSARSFTGVNWLLKGSKGLPMPYDGTGVILGVVDCGIEFNHMAFKDANGVSRVSRVYLPASTGQVTVGGLTLSGKDYTTPGQIASLTIDDRVMNHGTHTTGIAAGTKCGLYGGMAPGTELVLAGIPNAELSDITVARGVQYIAAYAASVGKPCVINLSLGNHDGPHDGTGVLSRVMEELNRRYGTIFVLSAGNEGDKDVYLTKQFSAADGCTMTTALGKYGSFTGDVDMWSRSSSPLSISYGLYSASERRVVCSTGPISCDSVLNMEEIPDFAPYMRGTVTITQGIDSINGKYRIYTAHATTSTTHCLVVTVHGAEGEWVDAWDVDNTACFDDLGVPGYTGASAACSISDMATGETVMSVGACVARTSYPSNGYTYTNGYVEHAMGRFSSYGTALNDSEHPFVIAPGVSVVSAVSRFMGNGSYSQRMPDADGNMEYWSYKSGTSMSAPCVAGIVALWLQACPSLTIGQIKHVIESTAVKTASGSVQRGPNGEIDALAGVKMILAEYTSRQGDVNGDGHVDIEDINILINIILSMDNAEDYQGRADVNGDGHVDVVDANMAIDLMLGL